ncbi:hypothetical protein BDZ97DRAFT_1913159 [Flammula alnicola]|nr:hypothetical protein BDZ97DRAFT_1913159 [Flammula alnicola]
MSSNNNANHPRAPDYGLPPRPPTASTPLWTHLLRPNAQTPTSLAEMPVIAPPLAPLDKNATSMRILLHDTQANFENFALHVGKLLDGIKETKHEIKTTNTLFERDRETLMGDIIDLVNRSQKEIQKAMGSPAQDDSVESFVKDVNHRLNGLDQRLDAIQAFNQTHSQALQTQIQAVQILLDKQGSIVTAVLPLLPLLQAVPLHIDAVKNSIHESLTKCLSCQKSTPSSTSGVLTVAITEESHMVKITGKRKRRADSGIPSSSSSPFQPIRAPLKRLRSEDLSKHLAPSPTTLTSKDDDNNRQQGTAAASSSPSKLLDGSQQHENGVAFVSGFSPVHVVENASMSSGSRRGTSAVANFTTPRRPLSDLLMPPRQSSTTRTPSLSHHAAQDVSFARSNTWVKQLPSVGCLGKKPTTPLPPRILRVHTSVDNIERKNSTRYSTTNTTLANLLLPSQAKARGVSASTESSLSRPSGAHAETGPGDMRLRTDLPQNSNLSVQHTVDANNAPSKGLTSASVANQGAVTAISKGKNLPLALTLGKVKERRSPIREGRRFIPLVDSEDEEDEN